ncbi:MAG TPA: GPW/gp25 family protein [Actinomycetota bacterium]|nr:GPW/gp25 family protein [Actinomycetota bacterium]
MNVDWPFHVDGSGRAATTSDADHVRDLVEQVLFTAPGERVNRPAFGTGLPQLVFAPNSPELATTTQFLVQGALQQWLGDVVVVEAVDVVADDALLEVTVQYSVRRTQERRSERFERTLT